MTSTQAGHYSELHVPRPCAERRTRAWRDAMTSLTGRAAGRGAVLSMALCVMVLIASEFMPVSLLTPIASDLRMTEGLAGQAISISGVFAVLTSLIIAGVTARLDRRTVLLSLTALMIVSGTVVAMAPNFAILMLGRACLGVAIGGFWSMSTATVMRLVPEDRVPHALAILNGGNALAATIAAPLGSYVGSLIGWRWAFFSVVPLAAVALAWQLMTIPSMRPDRPSASMNVFTLLRRPSGRLRNGGDPAPLHGAVRVVHLLAPVSRDRDQGRRVSAVPDAVGDRCRRSGWDVTDRIDADHAALPRADPDSTRDGGTRRRIDCVRELRCGAPRRCSPPGA